jgi:hypothetical protein
VFRFCHADILPLRKCLGGALHSLDLQEDSASDVHSYFEDLSSHRGDASASDPASDQELVPTTIGGRNPRNTVVIASVVVSADGAKSNVHIVSHIQCLEGVEDVVGAVGQIFLATIMMQA